MTRTLATQLFLTVYLLYKGNPRYSEGALTNTCYLKAMQVHVYRGTCTRYYRYMYAGIPVLRYYWILLVPVYCSTGIQVKVHRSYWYGLPIHSIRIEFQAESNIVFKTEIDL